ncbi:5'-methylthioadenosine/adenosylhomocysteine nucleosidase [Glaciecola petra]|uniref:5'-methylthioadenosine/S-adenosylhomocysteine nucleosidase n=1 Tax=Glaciecola petra TaxID=3075602 RepID=A0ABU2ZUS3_9ALTE|nr:5'-methylthioadenosine/adenosylhomocysteine nucleosidase [Aestuariibacter sp. P117]MDT0596006.1 5'-methylthioadenosine/adenosylhomocysteine nucleosidase [Aestuariibacter sp. P117]
MNILILGAMEEEITLLKEKMLNLRSENVAYLHVYRGNISGHEISLVQCGIGKVASAAATALLIQALSPDYVINTGSAGGFDPELDIGDVVIATELLHHDVNVTHFGYELGQVPQMPLHYKSDKTLVQLALDAIGQLTNVKVTSGLVCSGDSFVGSDEAAQKIRDDFVDMKAVEMEGAAIAQVCHLMNTPFVVIRSLSDIAGKTSSMSFDAYLVVAAKNSAEMTLLMLKNL